MLNSQISPTPNGDTAASADQPIPSTAKVIFQPIGRQGDIATGTTLLEAARRLGVEIESICGGHQTCRKCKIFVEEGDFAKFGVKSSCRPSDRAG